MKCSEQSTPDHAAQAQTRKPNAGRHGRECNRSLQLKKRKEINKYERTNLFRMEAEQPGEEY